MAGACSTSGHRLKTSKSISCGEFWPLYGVLERGPPGPLMIHDADQEVRAPMSMTIGAGRGLRAQDPDHRLVHAEVAGEQRRAAEFVGLSRDVAHDATCLAHQQQAGGDIPRRQPVLEEGVVAA